MMIDAQGEPRVELSPDTDVRGNGRIRGRVFHERQHIFTRSAEPAVAGLLEEMSERSAELDRYDEARAARALDALESRAAAVAQAAAVDQAEAVARAAAVAQAEAVAQASWPADRVATPGDTP